MFFVRHRWDTSERSNDPSALEPLLAELDAPVKDIARRGPKGRAGGEGGANPGDEGKGNEEGSDNE